MSVGHSSPACRFQRVEGNSFRQCLPIHFSNVLLFLFTYDFFHCPTSGGMINTVLLVSIPILTSVLTLCLHIVYHTSGHLFWNSHHGMSSPSSICITAEESCFRCGKSILHGNILSSLQQCLFIFKLTELYLIYIKSFYEWLNCLFGGGCSLVVSRTLYLFYVQLKLHYCSKKIYSLSIIKSVSCIHPIHLYLISCIWHSSLLTQRHSHVSILSNEENIHRLKNLQRYSHPRFVNHQTTLLSLQTTYFLNLFNQFEV